MKHDFVAQAMAERDKLPDFHPERIILGHLINTAQGRDNASPWKSIENVLLAFGLSMSKEDFQQGLLKRSRQSPFYIGSWHKGYFLIVDEADANVMIDFYHQRVHAELQAIISLQKLL
jgi:hypothetical protein